MRSGHIASTLALMTTLFLPCAVPAASSALGAPVQILPPGQIQVRMVDDEAEAVLAILRKRKTGTASEDADWARLFGSEGYRALAKREAAMGRAIKEADFRAFVESDTLARRSDALAVTLSAWARMDVSAAAAKALAYLPAGTPLRATVFFEIKPRDNSFVFTLESGRAIFLYLDPHVTPAQLENTVAHELHHVGSSAACSSPGDSTRPANVAEARTWMTAFGEGLAMLAAAGGPEVHPHAADDSTTRARWDRDVARFNDDLPRLEKFFREVLDRGADADSLQREGMGFFGVQGPWYTVGWKMASTIERVYGRTRLIEVLCDPPALLSAYNSAATMTRTPNQPQLATWSDSLLARVR